MKNLKPYSEDSKDCFEVYKEAIKNKRKDKEILLNIQSDIESQFDIYSGKFRDKKLYEVISLSVGYYLFPDKTSTISPLIFLSL